ncbi:hypothetical protein [Marilutibacter chinensis]|uniref:Uncharacterized protein n=1 Tax=Marilutibacter chinensis TaxID=2912247 RepID=A0ABS9HXE8_9GAMM|nr:hypothetical protein [Lysobacter chinensis]MCF7221239.1 hypothetical protein [Lysobacter chinensis]MCF7223020.1 hypothetical protein [Lysobacter chinensis]
MSRGNSIGPQSILASIALLLGASALDATAQTAEVPSAQMPRAASVQPEKGDAEVEARSGGVAADRDGTHAPRCMRQTGSNIRSRDCTAARGRAHDRDDQEASGRADVGTRVHAAETSTQILNRAND